MEKLEGFSVDNFLATVKGVGLSRENRFIVSIPEAGNGSSENGKLVSLMCESATIPQLSLRNKTLQLQGPYYSRATNIDFGGGSWTATFYVDREFKVKDFFDRWIKSTINPASFTVNYHADYVRNIIIQQLDEQESVISTYKLVDAYPSTLSALNLSQAAQNSFHKLSVSFVYRYWDNDVIQNTVNADQSVGQSFPPSQATTLWADPPQDVADYNNGYYYP